MSIEITNEIGTLIASSLVLDEEPPDPVARWQATIRSVHACAAILRKMPLDQLSADGRHADAIGWAIDPTLYRDKAPALRTDLDVLRAAARFSADVEAAIATARAARKDGDR